MSFTELVNTDGEKQTEPTMTSMEVAEMMGKNHKELLRDIRTYMGYFDERKVALCDFFTESEYIDPNNRQRPCYLITKSGCEFLAHKSIGAKGAEFTARYIERFHQMEQELQEKKFGIPTNYMEALEQLLAREKEKQRLLENNSQLHAEIGMKNQIIGELKPKADYTDQILKSTSLVTITQIAKDYGMSGQEMNKLLHSLGVQYKESDQWLLYSKYHDLGYTHSETVNIPLENGTSKVKMCTKWTQKGRLFLYELLKKQGTLPMIERMAS